ncbi:MAG TPA: hypothetical protein VJP79_12590 [Nitrososphaera sp.]|nr:hypothetical protein [Nitrososphaera sp.]
MKVELELSTGEEDESAVMDKISEITRYAKERGFRVDEIEIKRDDKEEEGEEDDEEEHSAKEEEGEDEE